MTSSMTLETELEVLGDAGAAAAPASLVEVECGASPVDDPLTVSAGMMSEQSTAVYSEFADLAVCLGDRVCNTGASTAPDHGGES